MVNQIPSPIGETLFGSMSMGTDSNMMDLDNSGAIYAYNCPTGTCQVVAYQVWEAMPGPQKEAYLSAVMDGILQWHPDATPTITFREWLVGHAAISQ